MSVAGSLAVDGPLEVEALADEVGPKVKDLAHGLCQHLVRDVALVPREETSTLTGSATPMEGASYTVSAGRTLWSH